MTAVALRFRDRWFTLTNGVRRTRARPVGIAISLAAAGVFAYCLPAAAQVNGVGDQPYFGWSSFSQQTLSGNFLTQANMMAQSDALAASGLQQHGFNYINVD